MIQFPPASSLPERYGLSWPGKAEAFAAARAFPERVLHPDHARSREFDVTEHVFVEGDNLEVLQLLRRAYFGKVKLITLDPPYNTGSDTFIYGDRFAETQTVFAERQAAANGTARRESSAQLRENKRDDGRFHANWLSMMYPRLLLARDLLRDDGVLIVSMDDHEVYSLKLLLDELFGEENFLGNVIWNSTKSVTNTALLSVSHTHNLVYFKQEAHFRQNRYAFRLPDTPEGFGNPDNDARGPWKADPFQVEGERPNQLYPVTNPNTGQVYRPNPGCSWKNDKSKFDQLLAEGRIVFGSTGEAGPQRKRFWSEAKSRGRVPKSLWTDVETTANATQYLKRLIGKKVFTNPKPVELIRRFIQLGTGADGDVVLDFFGGSGTTAEAVLQQNVEDGLRRKFLFVTLDEPIDARTQAGRDARSLGCRTIADVARLRIDRVVDELRTARAQPDLHEPDRSVRPADLGYRSFRLAPPLLAEASVPPPRDADELRRQFLAAKPKLLFGEDAFAAAWEWLVREGFALDAKIVELDTPGTKAFLVAAAGTVFVTAGMSWALVEQAAAQGWSRVVCLEAALGEDEGFRQNLRLRFRERGIAFEIV